ncbi:aminotransferase DegT [Planctomycetales bacterium]|nr:aminotransferase DegT [Planctomycetales bacterium]
MIPVNEPLLNGNEEKYVRECVATGWISSEGQFIDRLEKMFAEFCGRRYGVAVCNGTAALEVALYAAGIRAGSRVIMPSFTIISCALAAIRLGAIPLLVDMEPATWCMDVEQAARLMPRTDVSAVMPVHIYGHPVNLDPLLAAGAKHNVAIIEDIAEAHGAEYLSEYRSPPQWKKCGSFGKVAAASFYANKIITTGEGGMVLTDDDEVLARARSYRNLCFGKLERFRHEDLGYNFRLSNLQAAVGVAQMERAAELVAKKRQIADWYHEELQAVAGVRLQPAMPWAHPVYWMMAVELSRDAGKKAVEVMEALKSYQIGTRPFFMGLHAQPVLRQYVEIADGGCPRTEAAYEYGFYLPSGIALTREQAHTVGEALKKVLRQ